MFPTDRLSAAAAFRAALASARSSSWRATLAGIVTVTALATAQPISAQEASPSAQAAVDSIVQARRAQGARPIPHAMDGITVSDVQRAAMLASWELVRERWDAIMVRMRSGQPLSLADRATLRALSEEHNARAREWRPHRARPREAGAGSWRDDTALFGYDAAGNMVRADNYAAKVRRGYAPSGALVTDTLNSHALH